MGLFRAGYIVPAAIVCCLYITSYWPQLHAKPQSPPPSNAKQESFESDILPLFAANCAQCHGQKMKAKELDLSSFAGVARGSESGPIVVPGKPDESLLYQVLNKRQMPPGGKGLPEKDIAAVKRWIEGGAEAAPHGGGPRKPAFESDILPIVSSNCVQCHGEKLKTKELNLSSYAGVSHGSESGPVIVPGKPDESRLYQMVSSHKMPPGKALPEQDIATIKNWIESGAESAAHGAEKGALPENISQQEIVPIMLLRCTVCHGLRKQEGGLDLRTKAAMLKGGKSGPAIVLGKPEESLLVKKVRAGVMPPKDRLLMVGVKPISPAEIDKIAKWIGSGAPELQPPADTAGTDSDPLVTAKDRQFWAFQPPRSVEVPKVRHADRVRNPIDAFILQKLEEKNLSLSPEAGRLTLIRRATFDLTGLPPKPEEVQAFAADKSPGAYEKVIDRLLASPHYGERWGRHWLDVAGYADSNGGKLSADLPRPHAWRYRDYVIRAFNADKPYDRFLVEQIAGDELMDYEHAGTVTREMMDDLIATGFLRMGPDSTSEREVNFVDDRLDVVADEVDIFSSGVLGLTMKCARCHSHKYDPIPQRDYYRLTAMFKGAYDEHDWITPVTAEKYGLHFPGRYLPYVRPGASAFEVLEDERQRVAFNRDLERQVEDLKTALEKKSEPVKKKILDERFAKFPKSLHDDLIAVANTPKKERTEVQKYLAAKFESSLKIDTDELADADPAFAAEAEQIEIRIKQLEAKEIPEPRIEALWDRGEPSQAYIYRRGSPGSPGPWVEPGVPAVLSDPKSPMVITPPWPGAKKTGRRLALAKWLTQPDHPLTSRVMVNRVWKLHFGAGIVKSLANFGKTGTPPTHPELLDWLSREFVSNGWSIKKLHRLIMTSSTYRQVSTVTPEIDRVDPDNKLLSHMPLTRLEAEQVYDTMLVVSGKLDDTPFGVPDPVLSRKDGLVTPIPTEKGWRRSIYIQQRRNEVPTVLATFDLPPMSPDCLERPVSTVAPQALHLMNNTLVQKLAAFFAARVASEAGAEPGKQIERAYWIALSRPPTEEEVRASTEALAGFRKSLPETEALAKFCHTLINSAAFMYVD